LFAVSKAICLPLAAKIPNTHYYKNNYYVFLWLMKRKHFLLSSLPLLHLASAKAAQRNVTQNATSGQIIPPYLITGSTIGITSPAGYISEEDILPAVKKLQEWGFKVKIGNTIGKRHFTFGGTDTERAQDFQNMLEDTQVDAIMCARGGYGFVRIIDAINFKQFIKSPKWIIGFSDITVLHQHIHQFNIASLHAKMCNSFVADFSKAEPEQITTIESIKHALCGNPMIYNCTPNLKNKLGIATGILIGGNLKTIESNAGSASDFNTTNKILFVEDTGEYLYSIDRMFWNLKRTGKLAKLRGLIIGGFKIKKDEGGDDFGKTLEEIVLEKITEYNYPVCFDFPVGHQKNNYALKCGVAHQLTITTNKCTLNEVR
jgi:muramoyltetrapeptide carboxypeptidase